METRNKIPISSALIKKLNTKAKCVDCGSNTLENETQSLYMINDDIWKKFGAGKNMLCLNCLEKRAGFRFTKQHFKKCLLNKWVGLI